MADNHEEIKLGTLTVDADFSKALTALERFERTAENEILKVKKAFLKSDTLEAGMENLFYKSKVANQFKRASKILATSAKSLNEDVFKNAVYDSNGKLSSWLGKSVTKNGRLMSGGRFAGSVPSYVPREITDEYREYERAKNSATLNKQALEYRKRNFEYESGLRKGRNAVSKEAARAAQETKDREDYIYMMKQSEEYRNAFEYREKVVKEGREKVAKEWREYAKALRGQEKGLLNERAERVDAKRRSVEDMTRANAFAESNKERVMADRQRAIAEEARRKEQARIELAEKKANERRAAVDQIKSKGVRNFVKNATGMNDDKNEQVGGVLGGLVGTINVATMLLGGAFKAALAAAKVAANALLSVFKSILNVVFSLAKTISGVVVKAVKGFGKYVFNVITLPFKSAVEAISELSGLINRFMRQFMTRVIRTIATNVLNGLKEGRENMYQWAKSIEHDYASSVDKATSATLYLKNALATLIYPFAEAFANSLKNIVTAVVEVINAFNNLTAQMMGKSQFVKATFAMREYAEAASDAGKATGNLLYDFDKLHQLTVSSSGNGSKDEEDYSDMFKTEMVDVSESIDIIGLAKKFGDKISESLNSIDWDNVVKKAEAFGKGVGETINNLIAREDVGSGIGKAIAGAINAGESLMGGLLGTFDPVKAANSVFTAIDTALTRVNWEKIGQNINATVRKTFDFVTTIVEQIKASGTGDKIGKALKGLFASAFGVNAYSYTEDEEDVGSKVYMSWESIFKNAFEKISGYISGTWVSGIPSLIGEIFSSIAESVSTFWRQTLLPEIVTVGVEIGKGLYEAVKESVGNTVLGGLLFGKPFTIDTDGISKQLKDLFGVADTSHSTGGGYFATPTPNYSTAVNTAQTIFSAGANFISNLVDNIKVTLNIDGKAAQNAVGNATAYSNKVSSQGKF